MLPIHLSFFPAAMALLSLVGLLCRRDKTAAQYSFLVLEALLLVAFFCDAALINSHWAMRHHMLWIEALNMLVLPTTPLLFYRITCQLGKKEYPRWIQWLYLPPVLSCVALFVLAGRMGMGLMNECLWNIEILGQIDIAHWSDEQRALYILIMMTFMVEYIGGFAICTVLFLTRRPAGEIYRQHPLRDLLQGKALHPYYYLVIGLILVLPVIGLRSFFSTHWLREQAFLGEAYSFFFALGVGQIGALGLLSGYPQFRVRDVFTPLVTDSQVRAYRQSLPEDYNIAQSATRWIDAIRHAVEDEQMYLQEDITIERVAERVGTNPYYISRAINLDRGESFRDYIHRLRIEYSKQYMREHPDAKQIEIAEACGYRDAVAFNKRFTAIVGCTPKSYRA